jgi:hypothetical protein
VATRPPQAHHWLTVDFTDETENATIRKMGSYSLPTAQALPAPAVP